MKKNILIIIMLILTSFVYVHAEEGHSNFTEALEIIENKVSCDSLTDNEFELLGDYYMELMHPGEAHERMDDMMGGEGSDSLRLIHINMGKSFYCNNGSGMGMMGSGGMMGGGMMKNYNYQNKSYGFQIFFYVILTLVIVVLILLVILLINKSKKSAKQKGRKTK
ncbi:MAG: hypothetical protein AABW92_03810 [Nanoarchaeota archaeon]